MEEIADAIEKIINKYRKAVEPYVVELVDEYTREPSIDNDAKTGLQMKIDDTLNGAVEELWQFYGDRKWDEDFLGDWHEHCAEQLDELWVWSERETAIEMVDGEEVAVPKFCFYATMDAIDDFIRDDIVGWIELQRNDVSSDWY